MSKEKKTAVSLINRYKNVVYPYVGSAFMTGDESEELKFNSAKKEAEFICDLMQELRIPYSDDRVLVNFFYDHKKFWFDVKEEINQLDISEIFPKGSSQAE